jgi:hypothetical protein
MSNTEQDREAERAAFEEQLASDQSAREALAQAVQLTCAVRAACRRVPAVAVSSASSRSWLSVVAGCSVAALVLVSLALGLFDRNEPPFGSVPVTEESSAIALDRPHLRNAGSLVAMWTESSSRRYDSSDDAWGAPSDLDANCIACLDAGELTVPSWMLAAVGGDSQLPTDQVERHEDN